MVSFNPKY